MATKIVDDGRGGEGDMNIGIDIASGPDITRLVLYCTCGTVDEFDGSEAAYDAGWRLRRQRTGDEPYRAVCPMCMAKRNRQWRRRAVTLYGAKAVDRADQIMREKHR